MKRSMTIWMVGAAFLGTTLYVLAEELILTTYYPSPRGVYKELRVGSGSVSTPTGKLHVVQDDPWVLAPPAFRVDDQTPPDPTPFVIDREGKVGIGTATPDTRTDVNLDVAGHIIAGVATPVNDTDAANKAYVLAQVGGGCYVSYNWASICLPGFTNKGAIGNWGYCQTPAGEVTFRPPRDVSSCMSGWTDIGSMVAYLCCQ